MWTESEKKMEIKTKKNSPNIYPNRNNIHLSDMVIVNHITEGGYNSALNWLCNPKSGVSAHFLVGKNGDIAQLVDLKDGSWANGTSSRNKHLAPNRIIRETNHNANLISVSIEHEGVWRETKGELTEEQYQATLWLHNHIMDEVKRLYGFEIPIDREHIIGHCDINPRSRVNCPGQKFPFDRLIEDLKKTREKEEPKAHPQPWKLEGLEYLASRGIVKNKEDWLERLDEPMPAWAIMNIVSRAMGAV